METSNKIEEKENNFFSFNDGFKSSSRQMNSHFVEKKSKMNRSLLLSHLQVIGVVYHKMCYHYRRSMELKIRKCTEYKK